MYPWPAPRIINIVHITYFLGRPGSNLDTHVAKFEVICTANDVLVTTVQEVFVVSLQKEAFA